MAVGEVGLDFWVVKDAAQRQLQRRIFTGFIDLALELDLPLNVHSRSAGRHAVELLMARGARRVQMHAFDGKITAARPALEAGYFFSIPPSIVRSRQKQKLVRHLPLEALLVETDCPVLGPDPQVRNEPANLTIAIAAIAEIKQVPNEQVVASVVRNTRIGVAVDNPAALRDLADRLKDKIKSGIVVLGSVNGPKAFLIVGVTKDLTDRFHAGDIIKKIAPIVGGGGGGRPDLAQAGGTQPAKLDQALQEARNIISKS